MKLGCTGCLLLVVFLVVLVGSMACFLWVVTNIHAPPDTLLPQPTRANLSAAQGKLIEIGLRDSGRSNRREPIVLTEPEATALLARYLEEAGGLRLAPLHVRLTKGELTVQGRTPFRKVLQGPPFTGLLPYIPDSTLDRPIWVTVRGRLELEAASNAARGRYGRLTLTEVELGRQPVSGWLMNLMMGPPGTTLLRWPVPATLESVELQDGKAILRTR